jgi:hypothetical protein
MKPFCYHSFDLRQLVSFAESSGSESNRCDQRAGLRLLVKQGERPSFRQLLSRASRGFYDLGKCTRIVRNWSGDIIRRIALPRSRLHRKLHFISSLLRRKWSRRRCLQHLCPGQCARNSTVEQGKASRVEQDPALPKKSFDIGVKVRRIQAVSVR